MIERLLAAESAFARDEVDAAGRLFAQVAEADPRNAIAVVGLARVALREGRRDDAKGLAERALAIDPQEAAAARLLRELLLGDSRLASAPLPRSTSNLAPEPQIAAAATQAGHKDPGAARTAEVAPGAPPSGAPAGPRKRRSILARIRAWLGGK